VLLALGILLCAWGRDDARQALLLTHDQGGFAFRVVEEMPEPAKLQYRHPRTLSIFGISAAGFCAVLFCAYRARRKLVLAIHENTGTPCAIKNFGTGKG
jgi:hypothetical protein